MMASYPYSALSSLNQNQSVNLKETEATPYGISVNGKVEEVLHILTCSGNWGNSRSALCVLKALIMSSISPELPSTILESCKTCVIELSYSSHLL